MHTSIHTIGPFCPSPSSRLPAACFARRGCRPSTTLRIYAGVVRLVRPSPESFATCTQSLDSTLLTNDSPAGAPYHQHSTTNRSSNHARTLAPYHRRFTNKRKAKVSGKLCCTAPAPSPSRFTSTSSAFRWCEVCFENCRKQE